ncbi:MAG: DUF11 domain-containing protein [Proteobacteria bacterium]|nr:DUF11 domain-containing protein [Pseudomonadota bacterium]
MKTSISLIMAFFIFGFAGIAGALPVVIVGGSAGNQCETNVYTISIPNDSGNDLTNLAVTAKLENLTGFSYVPGSTTIDLNGGAFCASDPVISVGYAGTCAPAPSAPYLVWDIDSLCGPQTIANGEILNITFSLQTDCTAISGSLNTYVDYNLPGPTPICDGSGALNIEVKPGAIAIRKTPNLIPQGIGQDITWTLAVENTGVGIVKNVEVTDQLGAGLAYVSSAPAGINSGQITTWSSAEIAALAAMNPGDVLTIDLTATVIAADNLENVADVRFGCNPGPAATCFDSSVDGGTARSSGQRLVKTPLLAFIPPDITFDYCSDTENLSFVIENIGDGIASGIMLVADFSGLTVANVSAGAIYNAAQNRFELAAPLAAGANYSLSFDLNHSAWCGAFPSGDLLWQPLYQDEAGIDFYPPVELSTINVPVNATSLAATLSGAPAAIHIGGQITYTVTSAYGGALNCGSGSTGAVTVVDTVPAGFTVTDAGGGIWTPGGGGTGGTITWTYTPPASLSTTVTMQAPAASECEVYCNTAFINTLSASATDCCGCGVNGSDAVTTVIECEELVDSEKTALPVTGLRCDTIQYTNTYTFADDPALDGVDLSQLIFTENSDSEQEYVPVSLAVTLSGTGDISACAQVGISDTTPGAGGDLNINFSNCAALGSVRNKTLIITYDLTLTEATAGACSGAAFDSWSSLDLGLITGSQCLADGTIHETTRMVMTPPALSLAVSGLGQIIHKGEIKTVTLTLAQSSATADPKDVQLVLSGLNYYLVNPAAAVCGGAVAPTSCTPTIVGDDYVWTFGDGFTGAGQNATIQLAVQKRCSGNGDLTATAYFDDNCNDDAISDDTCSISASGAPALLLAGDIVIEKTPAVYYADNNIAQWEIFVTNRGTGTAYSVWVDDVLGSGLAYQHGVNPVVVDNMAGVTVNDSLDHSGGAINGVSVEIAAMAAGERRQITMIASQMSCSNLTNTVTASWGCIGVDCQTQVTDSSLVVVAAPNVINNLIILNSTEACDNLAGAVTIRNAGQVASYNQQATVTIPAGYAHVSGSTRWRLNGGGWNGPNVAYNPNLLGSTFTWTSTEISGLASLSPGDTIEIEFELRGNCSSAAGDIILAGQYQNPCGQVFATADSTVAVNPNYAEVSVSQTRVSPPPGAPIACGQQVVWEIVLENTGATDAPSVWVKDTLDPGFSFVSSTGGSDNGFNGYGGNPLVTTWEITNLNVGQATTLTLTADSLTALSPSCKNIDNLVEVFAGCGGVDGSSATKPGIDPPDNLVCLSDTGSQDNETSTRQPQLGFFSIGLSPGSIDACNDSTQLTVVIQNSGPTDASTLDLAISLPAGLTYNTGTAQSGLGTDQPSATAGLGVIADPAITGSTITFYDFNDKGSNLVPLLQADGGTDTLVLRFSVQSACYLTGNLNFALRYYDCCDDIQYNTTASQTLTALNPDLAVAITPAEAEVECGADQTWTIIVTNNGTGNAQVVRIEDTLDPLFGYVGSTPGATNLGGLQDYGWEGSNLAAGGGSLTYTLTGQFSVDAAPDCTSALRYNNARAIWGCGMAGDAVDSDPTTTGYDCTHSTWANAPAASLGLLSPMVTAIVVDPLSPDNLVTAVDGRGIYKSADNGLTWAGVAGQPASLRIKQLVQHPVTAGTLFAASYGAGIFTSTDGGDNWSGCANTGLGSLKVLALTIDPVGTLYTGTEAGIFTSPDCAAWSAVNTGLTVSVATPPVTIVVDPLTITTLYAGLDGAGVFKSENSGATWIPATIQPTNNRVRALVRKDSTTLFAATYGNGLFTSVNSGVDWTVCANTDLTNLNLVSLTIDGNGKLYAGSEAGVFVSTDNCATWMEMNNGLPN